MISQALLAHHLLVIGRQNHGQQQPCRLLCQQFAMRSNLLVKTIIDQLHTFRYRSPEGGNRYRKSGLSLSILVPILVGIALWWFDYEVSDLSPAIASIAIYTALLFNMLMHVFQLRVRIADSETLRSDMEAGHLVDSLEASTAYTVLVGIILAAFLVVVSSVDCVGSLTIVFSAIGASLFVHLMLCTIQVLFAIRSAYKRVRY